MTHLTRPVKRTTRSSDRLPYGVRADLVVTLYPGAVIGIREHGRRYEVQIGVGKLYAELVARAETAKKRMKRAEKKRKKGIGDLPIWPR
jgi:hypothetical protein